MSKEEYRVGELSETLPEPTQFEPKPFKKGRPPEPLSFEVVMTAEATEKQRKSGTVQVNIPG
ncbi:MAG: OsmC family peroxiredoxin, partial [Pseudomonadota bacterium]